MNDYLAVILHVQARLVQENNEQQKIIKKKESSPCFSVWIFSRIALAYGFVDLYALCKHISQMSSVVVECLSEREMYVFLSRYLTNNGYQKHEWHSENEHLCVDYAHSTLLMLFMLPSC